MCMSSPQTTKPMRRIHENSRPQTSERHPPFHDTIALMNRVATLMRAGVPTTRVFALATTEPGDLAALVTYASRSNQSISEAIAHVNTPAMRMFAALWHVAEVSGAPIAGATERAAASFELLDRLHQRRQMLLAGPKYTLYLVSLLPILAVLFGELLAFAPVAVLASPIGVPIVLIGAIFSDKWDCLEQSPCEKSR